MDGIKSLGECATIDKRIHTSLAFRSPRPMAVPPRASGTTSLTRVSLLELSVIVIRPLVRAVAEELYLTSPTSDPTSSTSFRMFLTAEAAEMW